VKNFEDLVVFRASHILLLTALSVLAFAGKGKRYILKEMHTATLVTEVGAFV
jgi:hypothetical protein